MIGKSILHYKILEKLGEGGMGIVYKAEDTKLNREVAIKILPPHLLVSEDDRARFHREAKAAAALNHAHIATVYEINETEDQPFIVMEYVEGATLDQTIAKGPLKLEDAIAITIQIADGLQAAHKKGVVHRDIKASNILYSSEKKAKILDFGLAKTSMSTKLTQMGTTIGTVAYMSPEQVMGKEVDHRTDLWSLGVLQYEMIAGHLPYKAEYDQAIFYSIQNENPDPLTTIRTGVPMSLEWIVNKLMAKNPQERYQSAAELIIDLKAVNPDVSGMSRSGRSSVQGQVSSGRAVNTSLWKLKAWWQWTLVLLTGIFLGALLMWSVPEISAPGALKEVRKFRWSDTYSLYTVSPDGKKAAYVKNGKLYIRFMDRLEEQEINNNNTIANILWSPDSRSIAYYIMGGNQQMLKRVAIDGSENVLIISLAGNYWPNWWCRDDSILFNSWDNRGNNTLLKISATGGELRTMYGGDSSLCIIKNNLRPVVELPERDALLLCTMDVAGFEFFVQDSKSRKSIFRMNDGGLLGGIYYAEGYIIYGRFREGTVNIYALPFDLSSMQVSGKELMVAHNASDLSVSNNGILFYSESPGKDAEQLVLLSRSGELIRTIGSPQYTIYTPAISKDGKYIATTSTQINSDDFSIWLYDLNRNSQSQFVYDIKNTMWPSWSPDGKHLVFQASFYHDADLFVGELNSLQKPVLLAGAEDGEEYPSWSPDGRYIFYTRIENELNQKNIWYMDMAKEKESKRLFQSRFNDEGPCMSPDGHYVAFVSDKSGQTEVYVTNFPKATRQWQISVNGGMYPQWIRNEIFFTDLKSNTLLVAAVDTKNGFEAGVPKALFSPDLLDIKLQFQASKYTITPDGQNIVAVKWLGKSAQSSLVMVENWQEALKQKQQ